MTTGYEYRRDNEDFGEPIQTKAVRAGKRTYFFDVKATRGNDYYMTITESRKRTNQDGSSSFTRHQIYLYKEDFEKFAEGLVETIEQIRRLQGSMAEESINSDNISFEEL